MAALQTHRGICVPSGSRDWFLSLTDPRAQTLRKIGLGIVCISEVRRGFDWPGPGVSHLLLGTIAGEGFLETDGHRRVLRQGDLVISPAGVARRFATQAADWKFLTIRLADHERWAHLRGPAARPLAGHWLRRLVPPVEGMLAEHPQGTAIPSHTRTTRPQGESPVEYLSAHYGHFFDGDPFRMPNEKPAGKPESAFARADTFVLHATILRRHLEGMLASDATSPDDDTLALAGLFSRVLDQPRGPWDAEDLASALGVSRTTLYRSVKRHYGTSPAKLVERLRMEAASRLLSESQHSIEVIADQVGYASAFSFSAAFKRIVGKPPSQFRIGAAADASLGHQQPSHTPANDEADP